MAKKERKQFVKCKECGVDIRDINMLEHMARAHGDKKAKETLEYIDKVRSLFSKEGVRTFVDEKRRMLSPQEGDNEEMERFLQGCEQELRMLSMNIQSGIPTGGMVARKEVGDSFDADIEGMLKTIDEHPDAKERKGMLELLKKLKGKTLFESLKNIQNENIEKEKKHELAMAMISLYPSLSSIAWKHSYGRVCKDCLMKNFKEMGCGKGEFWCVHDLYFNFIYEVVGRKIAQQVAEGALEDPEKTMENEISQMNIHIEKDGAEGVKESK